MARHQSSGNSGPRYVSDPVRSQQRWSGGFYTGEEDTGDAIRRQGERPHGWGNFESNYDLPSSEPRRVDADSQPNHRGKGPKGYARSDARTQEIICDELLEHPHIDASEIDVAVRDGEIRLSGTVDTRQTKHRVEELVERCTGNSNIVNLLKIGTPRTDE